jgi:predicted transcriptional regulator
VSRNDLEFIDVIVLKKIDADSTVESFGSRLGGIFESANILGGIKLKGYIDIHSIIGNSPVIITEKGNSLLHDLDVHSRSDISKIDMAVLDSIKKGFSESNQISRMLNINSRDIAYSLNKLWVKNYIDVDSHNGKVTITLTTLGFEDEIKVKEEKENKEEKSEADDSVKNKIAKEIVDDDDDGVCELNVEDDSFMGKLSKYSIAVIAILLLLFALIVVVVMIVQGMI